MSKQALKAIEIEVLSRSTLTRLTSGASQSLLIAETILRSRRPLGAPRCAGFVGALAFAGAGTAGIYIGVWLDRPNVSGDQTAGSSGRIGAAE